MEQRKLDIIRNLLRDNIMPATGCTEPVAVALCCAKAKEILGQIPERVELMLSKNVIKNAMGVGIPGTGMIGLPIAVSLGVVCGESVKGLDVLGCAKDNLRLAKEWMENHTIEVNQAKTTEKLYIECVAYKGNDFSKAIIAQNHTNFIHLQKNNEIIKHTDLEEKVDNLNDQSLYNELKAIDIFNYATTAPLEEIDWLMESVRFNKLASEEGLKGDYGLRLGKTLLNDEELSLRKKVIGRTCAASDARMDGATTAVYSNSGSGNQGITCTLPVYEFGIEMGKSQEEILRALMLSHLMAIHIKQYIGRLSALCGIVNASMGAGCGIMLLQGASFEQIGFHIKNMINDITGMVCDGAKPSCSLKISTGLNAAFDSTTLAMRNIVVNKTDGIAEKDVDNSIENLGRIGRYGMDKTDELILSIMTSKRS